MPTDNSWMNDQLRALTGTTVNLEDAGEEISAALRGRPSPSRVKQGKTKAGPRTPAYRRHQGMAKVGGGRRPTHGHRGSCPG
jgi:hypothetical protein